MDRSRRTERDNVLWADGEPPLPSGAWLPPDQGVHPTPSRVGECVQSTIAGSRLLIGLVSEQAEDLTFLVAGRPITEPPFDPADDGAVLTDLLPHIGRSLQVFRTMRQSEEVRRALSEVLDWLPEAVFLVDRQAGVLLSNDAAAAITRQNDGLSLRDGRLHAAQPGDEAKLRKLIAGAGAVDGQPHSAPYQSAAEASTMSITRPSGRPAFPVVVTPLHRNRDQLGLGSAMVAAVLTKDFEPAGSVLTPDLASSYHLTPGETRLATLVADGFGLKESARKLGITRNTARTHMKRVYAKIGVHSQADLVRLLTRGSIKLRFTGRES